MIDTVWITVRREARDVALSPGRHGARRDRHDLCACTVSCPRRRSRRATSHSLAFSLAVEQPRLRAAGFDESIAGNGTFLLNTRVFPQPGYNRGYEDERPDTAPAPGPAGPAPADTATTPPWITFEATVSTAGDQVAITPGTLEREWEEDGRRYFHYRSAGRDGQLVCLRLGAL